jgi:peroxiredoxin
MGSVSASFPGVGQKFPKVDLADARGGSFSWTTEAGETLFFFFKTDCPTSVFSLPFVERIHRLAADGGAFRVVGVSQDPPEITIPWLSRLGAALTVAYDPEPWRASAACGLASVPVFFLVSEKGDILDLAVGFDRRRLEGFARRACQKSSRPYPGLFESNEAVPELRPG